MRLTSRQRGAAERPYDSYTLVSIHRTTGGGKNGSLSHPVALAVLVADADTVAPIVRPTDTGAPALVTELSRHVRGISHVAVFVTHLSGAVQVQAQATTRRDEGRLFLVTPACRYRHMHGD